MPQGESTTAEVTPTTEAAVEDRLTQLFASDTADTATSEVASASEAQPDEAGSEQASEGEPESPAAEKTDEPETPAATVKVKVGGEEIEVPLDEALKGYSRTVDYTRKTQALAEERKKFQAEAQAVREARQKYDTGLAQIEAALKDLMPQEPNWDELRTQYPVEQVNAAWINFQRHKEHLAAIRAERERLAQQQAAEHAEELKKHIAAERERLFEVLPELKDEAKGAALRAELTAFALDRGFTLEELNNTADHRAIVLLHDAMQYHKMLAKQKQVSKKVEEQIKTAPPGTGNKGKPPAPNDEMRAMAKLAKTGSDEAAVELLLAKEARRKK